MKEKKSQKHLFQSKKYNLTRENNKKKENTLDTIISNKN